MDRSATISVTSARPQPVPGHDGVPGDEVRLVLQERLVAPWFPRCVDPTGGFLQTFDADWNHDVEADRTRNLVFQSRMTWLSATLAEGDARFADPARHGVRFLADRIFDERSGIFRWSTDDATGDSVLYGLAFAIFGLAAAARVLGNEEALTLAKRGFALLDSHHFDPEHHGLFEIIGPDGAPADGRKGRTAVGLPYGLKSQNATLHVVEALAELHRVWPHAQVATRLGEAIAFCLGPLYREGAPMVVTAHRDGSPAGDEVSLGHDIEASHLLRTAAEEIGTFDAEIRTKTLDLARVSTRLGFDGSFADHPGDETRTWWVQAEALLAFATLRGEGFEDELARQWKWIARYMVDHERGGTYASVSRDGQVLDARKGGVWKAAYHDGRALLYVTKLLS